MGLELNYINGQTPLDEDEKEGLLIKTITIRKELDEQEQLNIEESKVWLLKTKLDIPKILSEDFIKELHSKMFGVGLGVTEIQTKILAWINLKFQFIFGIF